MDTNLQSYYDNYLIESLNLHEWCNTKTFCNDLGPSNGQWLHRQISKSITNILMPFESLKDLETPKRMYSNERHALLQQCIKSNNPSKTYLQIIDDSQNYIKNELDKISGDIHANPLLRNHLVALITFLTKLRTLYLIITRDSGHPTQNCNKVLLRPNEYNNITFMRSANDNFSTRAEMQVWAYFTTS